MNAHFAFRANTSSRGFLLILTGPYPLLPLWVNSHTLCLDIYWVFFSTRESVSK